MPTAIEFFKLLPKTNCKECGQPTCLAFAMLLSNQKATIDMCPHVASDAKETLEEASAPPVRTVKVGDKDLGGETVLYRHERRFVNPTAYALTASDTLGSDALKERADYIASLSYDRVGMVFEADMVCLRNDSGDAGTFASKAAELAGIWSKGIVLETRDPVAAEAAATAIKGRRPLIYGADASNLDAMIGAAKAAGCPLGLVCADEKDAVALTERCAAAGFKDLVLDLGTSNLKETLERQTVARRAAVRSRFKPLGYPLMNRVGSGEYAVATAVVSTLKYGSLVVFDDLKSYEALPLFTLRQNIYTDPQVPIQVKQDLYPIGDPDEHSPIMFTTNFSLTYFTVRADIEKSKIPVWLQIVNTEGLSVLTAYSAGKFEPERVAEAFEESGVLSKSDGPVIIPGLVTRMSGKLQEIIGRKVIVGTNDSRDIPKHLRSVTGQ